MATNNGMPELEILFKGLGSSAIKRGERGTAVLIVKDETAGEAFTKYKTISDFGSNEISKYTEANATAIKDALEEAPLELYVFRQGSSTELADVLKKVGGAVPRNCWIAITSSEKTDITTFISWIKAEVKNNKKRYKGLVYKGTSCDDAHIVNFTTSKVIFSDERGEKMGHEAIPYLLGLLAGLPLTMSAIAKDLTKFTSVTEPEDLDEAISNGEFILFNDEGTVKVARAINSLTALGQDVIQEMTHINTVEKMDLIYSDIYTNWNNSYKGKYPNILDNQMILISAINAYFQGLARDYILDPNFENIAEVDIEAQRLENYSKYGQETVEDWTDSYAMKMTVGTKVLLVANIKISGIMEDFYFHIYM